MNEIKGFDLPFDFKKMKKAVDLIYEGGPILTLYVSDGDFYLFCWTDCDEYFNRWMIFRASFDKLHEYIDGKVALLDLIEDNPDGFVRFADYSGHGDFPSQTRSVAVRDVPADYLPESDSFFTFGITDEIRKVLLTEHYQVSIPKTEQGLFLSLMAKLGWKSSAAVW